MVVVAAVAQRRGHERRHPQAVDAEPLEVVQLLGQFRGILSKRVHRSDIDRSIRSMRHGHIARAEAKAGERITA